MRVQPFMLNYQNKNYNQTQFERKNDKAINNLAKEQHQYTGVASADLAYVSMFDNAIAQDLRMMGLI